MLRLAFLLFGMLVACSSGQNFGLRVEFPDQAARDQSATLEIHIIAPGPGAACADLLSGQAAPGNPDYTIEDSVTIDLTGGPASASVQTPDPGTRLFYAEARDSTGTGILHGCTEAQVGDGDVVIVLAWKAACQSDADCENDDLFCNGQTVCQEGHCAFVSLDCSQVVDQCNDSTCDEEFDACVAVPLSDVACEDGLYCTVDDSCQAGSCQSGNARDCTAGGGACVQDGVCDEDQDRCVGDPLEAGTPCEDGLYCSENDSCDGAGSCLAGDNRDCGDGETCTADSCSNVEGACLNVWTEIPGAEGLAVTGTCTDLVDNDCDGSTDGVDSDCVDACNDVDGDGYGNPGDPACPNGAEDDCDDDPGACGAACHPGAAEVCDGQDNDCNPSSLDGDEDPLLGTDCDGPDSDLCTDDSYVSCAAGNLVCSSGANDLDVCDGLDNDCDPVSLDGDEDPLMGSSCDGPDTDFCPDDSYNACTDANLVCSTGPDTIEGPFGDNTCTDSLDNDCDGLTDGSDPDCAGTCIDNDDDGYGNPGDASCPNGPEQDCDDSLASCGPDCYPGAPELCDAYDNDCDSLTDENDAYPDWWNTAWKSRRELTFNNSGQTTQPLQSFPVLVVLDSVFFDYTKTRPGGIDLRFIDDNHLSQLNYQIEEWNPAGKSYIWVQVPTIDAGSSIDHIWMYYQNNNAGDVQSPAGTWDANYMGVWHLNETVVDEATAVGVHLDSTSNLNHGTQTNNSRAVGQVAGGQFFDASMDYIQVTNDPTLTISSSWTLETWIYPNSVNIGWQALISKALDVSIRPASLWLNNANVEVWYTPGNAVLASLQPLTISDWFHLAATFDGTTVRLYIDGELDSSAAAALPETTLTDLFFGQRGDSFFYTSAVMDEIRISNTDRSADWIKAQYLSMTENFVTFSAEDDLCP